MADAGLTVALGLRLDQFEQQMSLAGKIAGDAVSDIEKTFANANITVGSAIGTAIGGAAGKIIEKLIDKVEELVNQVEHLNEASQRANVSVNELFRLQQVLGEAGLGTKDVNDGLAKMASLLAQSTRESTSLSKLFKENGDSVLDAAGKARPLLDILRQVADYMEDANKNQAGPSKNCGAGWAD